MVSVLCRTNTRSSAAMATRPASAVSPTHGSISIKATMPPTGGIRPAPTMTAVTPTWPASLAFRATRVTRSPGSKRRVAAGPIATRCWTSVMRSEAVHRAFLVPEAMSPITFPKTRVAISAAHASRFQPRWLPRGSVSRTRPIAVGSRTSAPAATSVASVSHQIHHPPRRPVDNSKRSACLAIGSCGADAVAGLLFTRPPHRPSSLKEGLPNHWVVRGNAGCPGPPSYQESVAAEQQAEATAAAAAPAAATEVVAVVVTTGGLHALQVEKCHCVHLPPNIELDTNPFLPNSTVDTGASCGGGWRAASPRRTMPPCRRCCWAGTGWYPARYSEGGEHNGTSRPAGHGALRWLRRLPRLRSRRPEPLLRQWPQPAALRRLIPDSWVVRGSRRCPGPPNGLVIPL